MVEFTAGEAEGRIEELLSGCGMDAGAIPADAVRALGRAVLGTLRKAAAPDTRCELWWEPPEWVQHRFDGLAGTLMLRIGGVREYGSPVWITEDA